MTRTETNAPTAVARVLIVDDHPAVREGLAIRIAQHPHLEVCGEAADVGEALQIVAEARPDVAVIDISLKTGDGIDLIRRIKSRNQSIKMLVWSMFSDSQYAERAIRAGAMGYINKGQATAKIIEAIDRVLAGKIYLSEEVADRVLSCAAGRLADSEPFSEMTALSNRELEVFQLIGRGFDTHQIGERLHVSMKTVETYRGRIKEKLKLTSGSDLLWHAMQWIQDNA